MAMLAGAAYGSHVICSGAQVPAPHHQGPGELGWGKDCVSLQCSWCTGTGSGFILTDAAHTHLHFFNKGKVGSPGFAVTQPCWSQSSHKGSDHSSSLKQ